jgi:phytoene synthase
MPTDFDTCAALVRTADPDRYVAALYAPAEHRGALHALYAFNIEIARVREAAREPMAGEIRLQWWREALTGARDEGEVTAHPVAAALRATLARYELAAERMIGLIDAHAFDLYEEPMATRDELKAYARNTEGVILEAACAVCGARGAHFRPLFGAIAVAYALTRLLVQLGPHAARRQLYVPLNVLAKQRVDREQVFGGLNSDGLREALADIREIIHASLAAGRGDPALHDVLPVILPAAVIGPTLQRMDRLDYDPFRFVPLPRWRRQWLIWRAAREPDRIFRD